jgi:hypothetical protein
LTELMLLDDLSYSQDIRRFLTITDMTNPQPINLVSRFQPLFRRHRPPFFPGIPCGGWLNRRSDLATPSKIELPVARWSLKPESLNDSDILPFFAGPTADRVSESKHLH